MVFVLNKGQLRGQQDPHYAISSMSEKWSDLVNKCIPAQRVYIGGSMNTELMNAEMLFSLGIFQSYCV